MTRFGHCCHCGDRLACDQVMLGFRSCSRCCQLLRELGDTVVNPPSDVPGNSPGTGKQLATLPREPGSDDAGKTGLKAEHNGKWLIWAANKRGCLRWFHAFGVRHGYPRNISQWTPVMVAVAVNARKSNA